MNQYIKYKIESAKILLPGKVNENLCKDFQEGKRHGVLVNEPKTEGKRKEEEF